MYKESKTFTNYMLLTLKREEEENKQRKKERPVPLNWRMRSRIFRKSC